MCLQVKNGQLDSDRDIHPYWSNRTDLDLKDINFDLTGPSLYGVVSHVRRQALAAQEAHRLPHIAELVSRGSWPWDATENVAPASEDWTDAVMKEVATDGSLYGDDQQWNVDMDDIVVADTRGTEASMIVPEDQSQRRRWLLVKLEPYMKEIANQIMSKPMSSEEFLRLTNSAEEQMELIANKMEKAREARPAGKRTTRGKSAREKSYEKGVRRAKRKKKHAVTRLAVDGVSGNSEDEVSFGALATPRRQTGTGRDTVPTRTFQQALTEYQKTHGGRPPTCLFIVYS